MLTHWVGDKATSPTVNFGGGEGHCTYSVTMKNIHVDLTLDAEGNSHAGTIQAWMDEADLTCSYDPIATNLHTYTQKSAATQGTGIHLEFAYDEKNQPHAELALEGTLGDGSMVAQLRWHRVDIKPPYDWVVSTDVLITKSPQ